MNLLIPFLGGLIFWAGGRDKFWWQPDWLSQKLWRSVVMGLMVGLLSGTWWAVLTYSAVGYCLHYGEKYQSKFGRIVWFSSGFVYGMASLNIWNGLFSGVLLYLLLWLSNTGVYTDYDKNWKLSHPWVEFLFGVATTIIWMY